MTRQRKAYRKSRGGCLTCKKRRVKCDETQPDCTRCSRAGLHCSWHSGDVPGAEIGIPNTVTTRIFYTARETRFFDFFRHQTIIDLCGWSGSYFWQRLVLQMAHSELATRRAVIALGAVHAEGPGSTNAARYYGQALGMLRQLLDSPDGASMDVCLATCLLLSLFEFARKDYSAAQIHYSRGVDMLKLCKSRPQMAGAKLQRQLPFYERTLLSQFSHLDTTVMSFLDSRPSYHQDAIFFDANVSQLTIPDQFSSLDEAYDTFIRLLHSIQNRETRAANQAAFAASESVADNEGIFPHRETHTASARHAEYLRAVMRGSLQGLERWNTAFHGWLSSAGGEVSIQQQRTMAVLNGISTALFMWCSRDPGLGEMGWDPFQAQYEFAIAQFERAVELACMERAQHGISSPNQVHSPSLQPQSLFSISLGILNAIYGLLHGSRDLTIRQRGLALLDRMPFQEGIWTGANARKVIGAICDIEDKRRVPGTTGPKGIKEEDRLVGVNFQFGGNTFKIIADRRVGREVVWIELDG